MSDLTVHENWMNKALDFARSAGAIGEVPVGAIVVKDEIIIGSGFNQRESAKNPLAHAEIIAINSAAKALGSWRLLGCSLYVTLEPCPMCAGAIINARIPSVIFGAFDRKSGCFASVADFNLLAFNHKPTILGGVLEAQCAEILQEFFKELRKK